MSPVSDRGLRMIAKSASNRSMVPLFQSTGARARFAEARDGHNWECWRDRLREGLSWLFPGPLWMVYE